MLIRSKPTKDHFIEDKRLETKPRHEKCNIFPTNARQNGVSYLSERPLFRDFSGALN